MPPTRRSMSQEGAMKPSGPHQRFTSSGSVHAFHTSSRGASNVRLSTSSFFFSRPFACFLVLAGIFVPPNRTSRLLASCPQLLGQPVEAVLPQDAVAREPAERRAQGRGVDLAAVHAALGFDPNQACALENPQVPRDRGQAHVVRPGELAHRGVPAGPPFGGGPADP